MVTIFVDTDLCHACSPCLASKSCKVRAIMQIDPGEPPYLEIQRCRDCQVCLEACPFGALRRTNDTL